MTPGYLLAMIIATCCYWRFSTVTAKAIDTATRAGDKPLALRLQRELAIGSFVVWGALIASWIGL